MLTFYLPLLRYLNRGSYRIRVFEKHVIHYNIYRWSNINSSHKQTIEWFPCLMKNHHIWCMFSKIAPLMSCFISLSSDLYKKRNRWMEVNFLKRLFNDYYCIAWMIYVSYSGELFVICKVDFGLARIFFMNQAHIPFICST